jgi:hypothetical protein
MKPLFNVKHPGKISYYELDPVTKQEKLTSTVEIDKVPEAMRFGDTPEGLIPIVKVVMIPGDKFREIIEYGPKNQFVRNTIQIRQ